MIYPLPSKKGVGMGSPRNNVVKQILLLVHWDCCPVVPRPTYVYFSVVELMSFATSLSISCLYFHPKIYIHNLNDWLIQASLIQDSKKLSEGHCYFKN